MNPIQDERLLTIAQSLVKIPSISSDLKECHRAVAYVAQLFDATRYRVQRYECNGRPSLVIARELTMEFDFVFLGHLDVVPADEKLFEAEIRDGWLYGRGAADMKGSVASMIELFLSRDNDPLFDKAALVLTCDEEVGGSDGARYLIEECGLRAKTLFNPDGGAAFTPCVGEKGLLDILIECQGVSAHGSRPWLGTNAINLLIRDIHRIEEALAEPEREDKWHLTFNLGTIQGGVATNSVAPFAQATLDIRFPETYSAGDILEKVRKAVKHVTVAPRFSASAVHIDLDNPALLNLTEVLKEEGFSGETMREAGASDARWFVEQKSNVLLMLPRCTAFHIDAEAVDIESLGRFSDVLGKFAERELRRLRS